MQTTALVTGASRGIGAATAERLARAGAAMVLAARSADAVTALASRLKRQGHTAQAVVCDVALYRDVEAAVQQALSHTGRLDILVINAGLIEPIARLADSDPDAWDRVIDVNTKGVQVGPPREPDGAFLSERRKLQAFPISQQPSAA